MANEVLTQDELKARAAIRRFKDQVMFELGALTGELSREGDSAGALAVHRAAEIVSGLGGSKPEPGICATQKRSQK